jgi:dihydroxyacetone kinase-like predicted kinase
MGRTVPTYRLTLESIIQSWSEYRRALPRDDREVFDKMVNRARMHASASTYAAFTDPVEGALLSILLEQEKEIRRLRKRDEGLDPGLLP